MLDEIQVKLAVKKLNDNINLCNNLDEINRELQKLFELSYRYASKNNNRHNKYIKTFKEYLALEDLEQNRKNKLKVQIKNQSKNIDDYLQELLFLKKEENYSYAKLEQYAQEKFKIKVSRETIRTKLKEFTNV